jgi:hypothetical protein
MDRCTTSVFVLLLASVASGQMFKPDAGEARVYSVGKSVNDMPAEESFADPEQAYAAINRRLAAGNIDWKAVSVARLGPKFPKAPDNPRPVSERAAQGWLGAFIVEVRLVSSRSAYVLAQWPASGSIDIRALELENGRWLNVSNEQADTIEQARRRIDEDADARRSADWWRKRTTYPQDHLKGFVEFLNRSARDPREFLLSALAERKLVVVGEIHHRPTYWKLNSDLVADPRFARHCGMIYLELPGNNQYLIDRFLESETLNTTPVIETLRDMLWMGWPDQAMLDFLVTVWRANQALPPEQCIRIVLVDMPRPWKLIQKREDWKAYDGDRDEIMAHNVLRDMLGHPKETRHGLFITGYMHAARKLRSQSTDSPIKTAGWRLTQVLGDQCFAVLQHGPQISNMGRVYGRSARGLFDSAFAARDHKPAAFALSGSPFGAEPFDAAADVQCIGTYGDAFDGYLFLERLEDEVFAAIIEGFYTDEFVKELDRRYRLTDPDGLESLGIDELTAQRFERWMSRHWGAPREWSEDLGSIDAWRTGTGEIMQR